MQDYAFDDCDYTICKNCHSSIQPYNNMSITTINVSIKQLASTHPFTKTLLDYNSLHCSKCGLYIKIHPKFSDQTSIQKIFICSNHNNPHKYCLCYHCGLLYGINPNQKSIDILNILQNKINHNMSHNHKYKEEEEGSLEVIDDNQDCSDDDNEKDKEMEQNKSKIDESYLHLIALQTKLNLLSNAERNTTNTNKSCPSSPFKSSLPLRNRNLSHSLRGSPLLGPSTPSPRFLGQVVDESEKKWQQYLLQQQNKNAQPDESTDVRLEKQQKKLEELQKLQKELSLQKRNSEQFAKLFRDGIYSKETGNKMTNFKFEI